MTLRQDILNLLSQKPRTSNEIAKLLGQDRSTVRKMLFNLQRQQKVKFSKEYKGRVPYIFWSQIGEQN